MSRPTMLADYIFCVHRSPRICERDQHSALAKMEGPSIDLSVDSWGRGVA